MVLVNGCCCWRPRNAVFMFVIHISSLFSHYQVFANKRNTRVS